MKRYVVTALFMLGVILADLYLLSYVETQPQEFIRFDDTLVFASIRNQQIQPEVIGALKQADTNASFYELLFAYFYSGREDPEELARIYDKLCRRHPKETEQYVSELSAVWSDVQYFPIPLSGTDTPDVSYEDSWMQSRTYGGARVHEGCDIMAGINQRGLYPVVSVCDGEIEKMGWLPLGGYRIGVRSKHGAYFYYAHMADYAEGLCVGDSVKAGTLLGFMGDTGYSDIEGTTGNFDVHLHFGIYLDDIDGNEFAVNSYAVLQSLMEHRLQYKY